MARKPNPEYYIVRESFIRNPDRPIREVAQECDVSLGYAQKIHANMIKEGVIPRREWRSVISQCQRTEISRLHTSGEILASEIGRAYGIKPARVRRIAREVAECMST